MRSKNLAVFALLALLTGGAILVMVDDADARGGGRGGRGGGGRRGGGRGRYGRKDGGEVDRPDLIKLAEEEMRNSDRDERFSSGRKAVFDDVLQRKREEVMARHRRMGEDTRRAADARIEVSL
jgi:hypothetical protein